MTEGTSPKDVLANHEDDSVKKLWKKIVALSEPLTDLQKKIKESSPPSTPELDAELKNSDDPKVVEFRTELEKLETALKTLREEAHKHILSGYHTVDDGELAKLKEKFGKNYRETTSAVGTLRKFAEMLGLDDVGPALDKIEFPSLRGMTRVPGGSGTTVVKARVESIAIKRKDGRTKTVKRFSEAGLFTGLETSELIKSWIGESGKADWQKIDEVVEFNLQDHILTVTPINEVTSTSEDDSDESEDE